MNSAWTSVAALVVIPFYLRLLGTETYGLVTLYATLQGLFLFFDFGLAATISREVARAELTRDNAATRVILRSFASFYWLAALLIFLGMAAAVPWMSTSWLHLKSLPRPVLAQALLAMAAAIAVRWPVGIYLGVLLGAQRAVVANTILIAATTAATFGAVAMLALTRGSALAFFVWQLAVGLVLVVTMRWQAWRTLPGASQPRIDWRATRPLWKFSTGIAVSTLFGAVVAQLDKLILPTYVPMVQFGAYGVATLATRPVMMLVAPLFSALYPYMSALLAQGNETDLTSTYRLASRVAAALIFGWTAFFAVTAGDLLRFWSGDPALADAIRIVAPLLAFGTALNAMMFLPHALQLAYGRGDIPLWINVILLVFFAPALLFLVPRYGITGAAVAWVLMNGVNAVASLVLTHRIILPRLLMPWLAADLIAPMLVTGGFVMAGALLCPAGLDPAVRLVVLLACAAAGVLLVLWSCVPQLRLAIGRGPKQPVTAAHP